MDACCIWATAAWAVVFCFILKGFVAVLCDVLKGKKVEVIAYRYAYGPAASGIEALMPDGQWITYATGPYTDKAEKELMALRLPRHEDMDYYDPAVPWPPPRVV